MSDPTNQLDPRSVTVVVATRDRPELLRRALDAIDAQEFEHDLEVIVVFDRSEPDRSLEFERPGRRLVVTTNARTPGLPGARNSGIDKAGNQWIAFCDDDDEWLPGKLAGQFAAIDRLPGAKAACTGIYIRYEGDDTARIPDQRRLTFEGFLHDRMTEVHPSSWLIQREWLTTDVGLVDEEIPGGYAEDYDLMLRAARLGPIAVAPEPLVRVWWHGASFFFERWKMIDEALDYLLAKYPEFETDAAGWARVEGQRAVAQAAMGQRRRALATIGAIVRRRPLEKRVPVALAVAIGVPPGAVLAAAHRFGRGI